MDIEYATSQVGHIVLQLVNPRCWDSKKCSKQFLRSFETPQDAYSILALEHINSMAYAVLGETRIIQDFYIRKLQLVRTFFVEKGLSSWISQIRTKLELLAVVTCMGNLVSRHCVTYLQVLYSKMRDTLAPDGLVLLDWYLRNTTWRNGSIMNFKCGRSKVSKDISIALKK